LRGARRLTQGDRIDIGPFQLTFDGTALTKVGRIGNVELHVRDDGPGISPEFAALAFQRFSRADQARIGPGSGLGLAIVRTISEAHGGTAQAAGSDVWLTLPG